MTGNKLQGCTLAKPAVFENFYGQNWMYVLVIPCVCTMKGLYLVGPRNDNLSKYAISTKMKTMIKDFECRVRLQVYTEEEYENMLPLALPLPPLPPVLCLVHSFLCNCCY
jgi:hypothetical protein